ncbi:Ubiquitin carboxyl-terminal hydrolase 8 [Frankliniella fusca]|uniref:Ubiquitin carboxyl-terminal hydrolase 8 n=1 Tax=Frankliniella fusca TaxID=407009 RepID=A0AAE1GSM9_9NEOP|nr:Ubiquitin carboxyl-terminal hydrolase 8 [Frankliniella fusca]
MVSRVTCTKCDYDSTSFPDASNHLSLDLDNCSSVVDCLEEFCKVTSTDGQCPSCQAENCQRIQTQFARIPPLLIIQLKRFRQYAGVKFGKIKQNISFDINLDLAPFMVGDLHSKTDYKLIAVQNHHGDLGHGHYYSLCQRGNRWYKFDDSRVTSMTTRRLVSEHAYLLCYEKPLDREAVLPFDLVSLSDALTSQLSVIPEHPDGTPPPADSNNNYHLNFTPDIFKSPEQSLHEAADTQSPPHDKDLSQFVVESTKASVRGNATLLQSNKRKETFSEVRGVKRLPLQSTQQEPHRCEHAPFNFDQSDPVLTEQDVMGAELDVENLGQYHVPELKRWLECRGVRRGTTKQALIKKIEDHVAQGKKDKIDPKVDDGIWVIEKKKKIALENPQDPRGYLPHLPVVGFTMWKPFPSIHIPQKYDYHKIEEYFDNIPEVVFSVAVGVVSRTQDASDDEVFDASLPTPDDRKRKYLTNTLGRGNLFVDSGRILSVYDYEKNGHYFIKSMVHASLMNKVYMTMLTIASFHGDVCNAICTCKANALGRCCHIAAVLLLIHRHIQTAGHEGELKKLHLS